MSPEQEQINELTKKVEELSSLVMTMQNPNTITPEFTNVLQKYNLSVSIKGADSEDIAVNEAGSSTYNVMADPIGFLEVNIGGATYYLPYFNA